MNSVLNSLLFPDLSPFLSWLLLLASRIASLRHLKLIQMLEEIIILLKTFLIAHLSYHMHASNND